MDENKLLLLEQKFENYKEQREKEFTELKTKVAEHEKRIFEIEKSKEKTDYQYEQIMETLKTLNEKTIPNLTVQIEELKNKPAKRYDQIITTIISAVIGAIVGAIGGFLMKK